MRALILLLTLLAPAVVLANVSLTIPNLPAGRQVDVRFQVDVNATLPPGTMELQSQATISGDNFATFNSNLLQVMLVDDSGLRSPAYFFWNGFLNIQNVAAAFDTGGVAQTVTARLFDGDGVELGNQPLNLPANGEVDFLVNLIPGFAQNAVGLVRMEFSTNRFGGNLFWYRFGTGSLGSGDSDSLEFILGESLLNGLTGNSYTVFNTIQPSFNSADTGNQVAQFLNIANLDASNSKTFDVTFYDQVGALIRTSQITIPPEGRRDLESGHVNPGPGFVGLIHIAPQDPTAPYIALNTVYGANGPAAAVAPGFSWALNTKSLESSTTTQYAPISNGGGADNYVVLANSAATTGTYQLDFFQNDGTNLGSTTLNVPGYGQIHTSASALLAPGTSGAVRITPTSGSEFIAYSTAYFRDSATQRITAAYATIAREIDRTQVYAGYNQFLRIFNYLKLFNVSGAAETTMATVNNAAGTALGTQGIPLASNTGIDQGIHELPFAPAVDTFGRVQVDNTTAGSVMRELLRAQFSTDFGNITAAESLPARR